MAVWKRHQAFAIAHSASEISAWVYICNGEMIWRMVVGASEIYRYLGGDLLNIFGLYIIISYVITVLF